MAAARQEKAAEKRHAIDALAVRANELIPRVLASLADRGYPDIEQIEAYVPRGGLSRVFAGAHRLAKMGAYRVSSYDYDESSSRSAGTGTVWLLSSGRLVVGSGSHTVEQFAQQVRNHERVGATGLWLLSEPFSIAGFRQIVSGLRDLS